MSVSQPFLNMALGLAFTVIYLCAGKGDRHRSLVLVCTKEVQVWHSHELPVQPQFLRGFKTQL